MPSQRKRIGFLPSEKVQEIIDKLCRANEFSQSKVTGLLVEEALRSRGVLSDSFASNNIDQLKLNNFSFEQELIFKNNKFQNKGDNYTVNNKILVSHLHIISVALYLI